MSKRRPTNCPTCDGVDCYEQSGGEYFVTTCHVYFECDSCGTGWTEVYEFSRIEITKEDN